MMNSYNFNYSSMSSAYGVSDHIKVGLIDDHVLLRRGLAGLLTDSGFEVTIEASNGQQFVEKLAKAELPDVVLTDINMPMMDGYATAEWLRKNYPAIKIMALSMIDDEQAVIKMVHRGATGYILKDSQPEELVSAIRTIHEKGFYHTDLLSNTMLRSLKPATAHVELTPKEITFLQYSCTEMTYKEIATLMSLSPRTIDGYRDDLFLKLSVRSRVGLVLYAIKNKLIRVN
jgi:two-component system, NarL family, invasion response regulator UvrY